MPPLHQILPTLEDAVRDRRACPTVDNMSEGDVRSLLYQVVDYYCRPATLFDTWIDAANETVEEFRESTSAAASTRAQVLTRILQLAQRSLAALGGKICTKIIKGVEQKFEHHPHLYGVLMGQTKRSKSTPGEAQIISQKSWWIVSLVGDTDMPDARWAVLTHRGEIDEFGDGEEFIDIELVSALDLAESTTNHDVQLMLAEFLRHLKKVGGAQSKLVKMTAEDKDLVKKMENALAAMGTL